MRFGIGVQDEGSIDFSRGLREVVAGRDERVHPRRSHRDVACLDFLAFVGNRVNLLQVAELRRNLLWILFIPAVLPGGIPSTSVQHAQMDTFLASSDCQSLSMEYSRVQNVSR